MKKLILLTALIVSSFTTQAQDIQNFLVLGGDGVNLLESYLRPAFEGTISNLNNGWYRTAKTHKVLGFDITLNASFASVPNNQQTFTFNNSNSSNLNLKGKTSAELPTVFGGNTDEVFVVTQRFDGSGNEVTTGGTLAEFELDAFDGISENLDLGDIGTDSAPLAMIQAGIGLPFKTDVSVRYSPEIGGDAFKTNLIGFGIKHNILQYFPIAKRVPFVDVSLFYGYTKITNDYFPSAGQSIEFETTAKTAELLASVDLKIINIFVGLGYSKGESTVDFNGDYSFEFQDPNSSQTFTKTVTEEELPSIKFDVDEFKTTAGLSLNLAFFKIYGSYTLQEYNAVNAGIAFSFR